MRRLGRIISYSLVVAGLLSLSAGTQARQLAFSFDDGLNPAANPEAASINHDILRQLDAAKIKAMIFPSLVKTGGEAGLPLVAEWGRRGHRIGNHSEGHINLNKPDVDVQAYLAGIENAAHALSPLPGWTERYRFPFLKEGDTLEKRDAVRDWLKKHGYRSGAVSIDASDWFYNLKYLAYAKAGQTEKLVALKKAYIRHLLDRADYYDGLAVQTLGYSPRHVILLHTNKLNAASLADIITAFRENQWRWIDTEQAYADPLYQQQPEVIPAGESIIWSLAKQKGLRNLRYPAEDAPYETENLRRFGLE